MTIEKQSLSGVFTALVTPFDENGDIDRPALEKHIDDQISAGIDGLVPVGTTGESPTLSEDERDLVIQTTVRLAAGRRFVLAGTGANDTRKAVAWTRKAEEHGADGCLVVTPYYNKPTQQGLVEYFSAVASATSLPIVLYSVPGRCGVEVSAETAALLRDRHDNIVGIKEAGGSVDRVSELRQACGDDFRIQSGDDGLTLPFLSVGAIGVISVVSNLKPKLMLDLVAAWNDGDVGKAQALHMQIYDLANALFVESSPVPVKTALAAENRMGSYAREPLLPISSNGADVLNAALSRN